MDVSWTVDGKPVSIEWSDAPMEAPGGYGNLGEVSCPASEWKNPPLFSTVVGTRSDGKVLYIGELSGPPRTYQGRVRFPVQGLQERLARQRGRRLYQNTGLDNWVVGDADPHADGSYVMSNALNVDIRDGAIVFSRAREESVTTADLVHAIFWAGDETITRVACVASNVASMTNYDIEIRTAEGPTGSATIDSATTLSAGGNTTIDDTLANPNTQAHIVFRVSTNHTTANQSHVRVRNVRVWGRTTTDEFSLADLGEDLAEEMGWDALSSEAGFNVLPQDWLEDWPGSLTEAAGLADRTWLIVPPVQWSSNPAALYVGAWGRKTWTLQGADYSDLVPQVVYNRATVAFETPSGVSREVTAEADPDPHAGTGLEVVWPPDGPYELSNRQYDSTGAEGAAGLFVQYYSQPRVSGQIPVGRVWADDGEAHPWDIDAGDLVVLSDYEVTPGADPLPPQRVVEVSRRPDGTATISLSEATSLESLIADLPARSKRKRKKRKRGKSGKK